MGLYFYLFIFFTLLESDKMKSKHITYLYTFLGGNFRLCVNDWLHLNEHFIALLDFNTVYRQQMILDAIITVDGS